MINFFDKDFSLEAYQKEVGKDFKIMYDVFCGYYLHIMEGKNKLHHAKILPQDNAIQIHNWLRDFVVPLYEKLEDYEMCKRIKDVMDFVKNEKKF